MKFLLKLKSWQLFVVLFIPFILSSTIPFVIPSTYQYLSNTWIIFYLTWIYALGTKLYNEIETRSKNKIGFVIFQILIFLTMIAFMFIPVSSPLNIATSTRNIIYLLSAIGTLYSLIFCAKILTIYERKQNPLFLNLVLLWIFPLGIWLIQPKIRKIFHKN